MNPLSFKEFLAMINEDAAEDISRLQVQKQTLINQQTPLNQRIAQINKAIAPIDALLLQAGKKLEQENKRRNGLKPSDKQSQQDANNTAQQNTTTTPGSAGAQTPGQ